MGSPTADNRTEDDLFLSPSAETPLLMASILPLLDNLPASVIVHPAPAALTLKRLYLQVIVFVVMRSSSYEL